VRIVFLTTDDPLYLPHFFDRVLASRGGETALVAIVPPLYAGQTTWQAVRRYYRTFGAADTVQLARRVVAAKAARRSVASVCARHDVASGPRPDVNAPAFLDELRSLGTDLIVSVSCPQLFRKPLIELPERGCLNVHGAVLPQYRGIMPSFWMLANGERQAGVSIYIVDERIDAGDLCAQRTFDISPDETLHEFLTRSKRFASDLLLETLAAVETGTLRTTPLDLDGGSYYSWPDREAVSRFRAAGRRLW
jgi:methionyl-tRNA formyltransferase